MKVSLIKIEFTNLLKKKDVSFKLVHGIKYWGILVKLRQEAARHIGLRICTQ